MNDPVLRDYTRWSDAEASGRDDEADAAFSRVFESATVEHSVSADFTARTMAAVRGAALEDIRRARRTRLILIPLAVVATVVFIYVSAGVIVSALSATVIWLLDVSVRAVVGVATPGNPARPDVWSIMASIGRAAAALLSNPTVTGTLLVVQAFAVAALLALQRLLGSDRESFR